MPRAQGCAGAAHVQEVRTENCSCVFCTSAILGGRRENCSLHFSHFRHPWRSYAAGAGTTGQRRAKTVYQRDRRGTTECPTRLQAASQRNIPIKRLINKTAKPGHLSYIQENFPRQDSGKKFFYLYINALWIWPDLCSAIYGYVEFCEKNLYIPLVGQLPMRNGRQSSTEGIAVGQSSRERQGSADLHRMTMARVPSGRGSRPSWRGEKE